MFQFKRYTHLRINYILPCIITMWHILRNYIHFKDEATLKINGNETTKSNYLWKNFNENGNLMKKKKNYL